jgi:carbon monoxide dehydrogenase subunit G
MKLKMSACIDASKEDVWKVLSDIPNVNLWVEPILSARCESEIERGIGTVRVCELKGNMIVKERWTAWDEGVSFTYQADEVAFFKSAKNKWSIKTENNKTLVLTESEVVLKGGIFGKILEPLMYIVSKKMGSDSLAALKHLVETGTPFEGRYSKLPRVSVVC